MCGEVPCGSVPQKGKEAVMHGFARLMGASALVVKEARIDESAEHSVHIVGRKAGLASWLMAQMGIDSTFTLDVYSGYIESSEGSLSGRLHTVIPFSAMDTATYGFTKPFPLILLGFGFLAMSFGMLAARVGFMSLFFLLIAGCMFVGYFLKKSLVLYFSTVGANVILFPFKRSIIEGVNVDEAFAKRVSDIVKNHYLAKSAAV